jgi:hypothetical protein
MKEPPKATINKASMLKKLKHFSQPERLDIKTLALFCPPKENFLGLSLF